MIGPGKYDEMAEILLHTLDPDALVLIVFNGKLGTGVSSKCDRAFTAKLPGLLRQIADDMEKDFKKLD